jgi:UDP-N-acetylmuramoyl-tripeptide--D-alanyl-D-alanine ligase
MNHPGEISALSLSAKPDIAVITNIGVSHIEYLGSCENILKAKMEITDGMDGGTLIVNGGDPYLAPIGLEPAKTMAGKISVIIKPKITEWPAASGDISGYIIEDNGLGGTKCVFSINGEGNAVNVPIPGRFNAGNALLAAAACIAAGMDIVEIAGAIEGFAPSSRGRMEIKHINGITVIDDTYNSNPDSVTAAVDVLSSLDVPGGRRVCVLGDMLELGVYAGEMHRSIGKYIKNTKVDVLIAIGDLAENIETPFHFPAKQDFIDRICEFVHQGDAVLIKASRKMAFEDIARAIENMATGKKDDIAE